MPKTVVPVLLLFAPLLSSFSQSTAERRFATLVSVDTLRRHVQTLSAMGNRWGGTPSGDQSARWVAAVMKRYGLEVEVRSDPEKLVSAHQRWTLRVVNPPRLRHLIRNDWLAGFSASLARTTAILADGDREEGEVEGKVLLTDRMVSEDLYKEFVRRGAIAILSYAPGDSTMYPNWAMITPLPASNQNEIPLYNVSFRTGSTLRKEMARGTEIRLLLSASIRTTLGSPKTVIGRLRGSGEGRYIVCAHGDSDSGGPGADDNASGVAGVLEVARGLSRLIRTGVVPRPTKTIEFVIWGSEYSSAEHFVKTESDRLASIKGVLNYDQIGTGETRNCLYFESNDIPHNEPMLAVLNRVGEDYAGKQGFWHEATTNPSQGGTDSYVFLPDYLARLDVPEVLIPSVTIYTAAWNRLRRIPQTEGWNSKAWKGPRDTILIDYSRFYHSSLDIPSVTTEREPFNMVWATKAVGIALLRMAWK
ncbi:MAG: hypothetical protein HBSIN02_09530 [Bacteroidia bacterium]|nr:MAG: hypothetical protein HBSIN02_09530 [Bacteroidia bacterium]